MGITVVPKEAARRPRRHQFEPSEWVTLDQERINTFADCTEDHQFIHIDEEKAAQTPFGGTIAHGFLTLSMLVKMCEGRASCRRTWSWASTTASTRCVSWRRCAPASACAPTAKLVSVEAEGRQPLPDQEVRVSVEIEGEETPALVAEWLTMVVVG
jgi:hypothetical protein